MGRKHNLGQEKTYQETPQKCVQEKEYTQLLLNAKIREKVPLAFDHNDVYILTLESL
jgi:hypothetical protein